MNASDQVSVVVLTYNSERTIGAVLESLCNEKNACLPDEVLVVDGGSFDHTQAVVNTQIERFPSASIRWIQALVHNQGKNSALGMNAAKHDLVIFLNAQCVVSTQWLQCLVKKFDRYQQSYAPLAAIGGGVEPPRYHSSFYDAARLLGGHSLQSSKKSPEDKLNRDVAVATLSTTDTLFYRPAVLKVQNFSPSYMEFSAGWELSHRLKGAGFELLHVEGAQVDRFLEEGWRNWVRRQFAYTRAQFSLFRRHGTFFRLSMLFPPFFGLIFSLVALGMPFVVELVVVPIFYVVVVFLFSVVCSAKARRLQLCGRLFRLLIVTHFAKSIGAFIGFLAPRLQWNSKVSLIH